MHQLDWLRCPRTGSRLALNEAGSLVSASGEHVYPVLHGIPDFRLFDPPYMTRQQEAEMADRVVEAGQRMNYDELLRHFEEEIGPAGRSPAAIRSHLEHRRALRRRSSDQLDFLFRAVGDARIPGGGLVLDLGCGSGEVIGALYRRGAGQVIGLDISLVELVLAKKLLEEESQQAFLLAGCAEALPLAEGLLDFIYSPDVIEHVSNQARYLAEARRALKSGGQILLNSPNRYTVVSPEPHTGIWLLGFLPRVLMDPACRLLGKGTYIGKRLVSLRELRRLLRQTFADFLIKSREANPHATSLLGKLFYWTRPWSERAFAWVCDQHVVIATDANSTHGFIEPSLMKKNQIHSYIVERILKSCGYSIIPTWRMKNYSFSEHLDHVFRDRNIQCVFDVGANIGRYRDFLREQVGFNGLIVSFEPIPALYNKLIERSRYDKKWVVVPAALAEKDEVRTFNLTVADEMSSFFEPDFKFSQQFVKELQVIEKINVQTYRLDTFVEKHPDLLLSGHTYLKLDTQGYDLNVLMGAEQCISKITGVQTELSFIKIYNQMPKYSDVLTYLEHIGFNVSMFFPISFEPDWCAVELDCILLRRRLSS